VIADRRGFGQSGRMHLPHIDWSHAITMLGIVASALGLKHWRDSARAAAEKLAKAAFVKGKELGRDALTALKRELGDGLKVFRDLEGKAENWVLEQGKKLPSELRDPVLRGAHEVFHEFHVYTSDEKLSELVHDVLVRIDAKLTEKPKTTGT
jgi:hypothetical protein